MHSTIRQITHRLALCAMHRGEHWIYNRYQDQLWSPVFMGWCSLVNEITGLCGYTLKPRHLFNFCTKFPQVSLQFETGFFILDTTTCSRPFYRRATTLANRTRPVTCFSCCFLFHTKCLFTDGFNKLQSLLRTWNFPFEPRLCFDPKLRSKCTKNPHIQSEHLLTGSSRLPTGLAAPVQDDASPSASHTPPTVGGEGWREGSVDRLAENAVFLRPS